MTSPLTVRPLTAETLAAHFDICRTAYYDDHDEATRASLLRLFDPGDFHGVFDGPELIGGGGVWPRRMTLPGTGPQDFGGITMVAVAPGHRRRGALTGLMRAQLHGLHERGGAAFTALWASEGGIYGRFGYGLGIERSLIEIDKGARFRPGVDTGADRVRELPRAASEPLIRELYAKVSAERAGLLARDEDSWQHRLLDGPSQRGGGQALRFAVHPEGYALYRPLFTPDRRLLQEVLEIVTSTPAGHAAIWRHLLDSDLTNAVRYWGSSVDEPMRHLLADARAARTERTDAVWVRLVDVDRALPLRHYAGQLETVLELADEFCPWNAGRWRLRIDAGGRAELTRTEAPAELALSTTELGAAFLGGVSLRTLAAAGRVRELRPGALPALSRAFLTDPAPQVPELF